ncbi:MAG: hypothetical protein AMJ94_03395 [Deltaproteobacteria bacterium SM23_61]|nr:MAG: hypothetical protein AMJ94_03395 [Deltaproteobacteria bacterium SM23_61]
MNLFSPQGKNVQAFLFPCRQKNESISHGPFGILHLERFFFNKVLGMCKMNPDFIPGFEGKRI